MRSLPNLRAALASRAELPGVQDNVPGPQASTTAELGMELLEWTWGKLDDAERSELTLAPGGVPGPTDQR